MAWIQKSEAEPHWYEVRDETDAVQEVEVKFPLRRIPKHFPSIPEALEWIAVQEKSAAKRFAYYLLARRSYPSVLLAKKLSEKGYSATVIEELLDRLQTLGYLNDADWAQQMIEKEFARGYGPRYIELKLKFKGVSAAAVREKITPSRQREKIRELTRKFGKKDRAKLLQKLARRGFDLHLLYANESAAAP